MNKTNIRLYIMTIIVMMKFL